MTTDLSIIDLILGASWPVKVVLAFLLLASIASWSVIIEKARLLKQAAGAANRFEASFWSGVDLTTLYKEIAKNDKAPLGMAGIFEAGYREFGRLKQESSLAASDLIDGALRAPLCPLAVAT